MFSLYSGVKCLLGWMLVAPKYYIIFNQKSKIMYQKTKTVYIGQKKLKLKNINI